LERAKNYIKKRFPDLKLVGCHHGYIDLNDKEVINEVKSAKPDLIFVGMGFPRQEEWIYQNFHHFDKGIFIGVGGTIDILAGVAKRAPESWQRLSAEWLYRFLQKPTRGKRMIALPLFAYHVIRQKVKGKS